MRECFAHFKGNFEYALQDLSQIMGPFLKGGAECQRKKIVNFIIVQMLS